MAWHKPFVILALAAGLVAAGLSEPASDANAPLWRLVFERDVSSHARSIAERKPLGGAHGAGSQGFVISDTVQGGAIIAGLDIPALGVFVGNNAPATVGNKPFEDLRVWFTLADGSIRPVAAGTGGRNSMLFQSPLDVPIGEIVKVGLYVNGTADWAK